MGSICVVCIASIGIGAYKHALPEDFEAIDTCLRNLFYMYEKLSKKT